LRARKLSFFAKKKPLVRHSWSVRKPFSIIFTSDKKIWEHFWNIYQHLVKGLRRNKKSSEKRLGLFTGVPNEARGFLHNWNKE
jgi:hypothetical protein